MTYPAFDPRSLAAAHATYAGPVTCSGRSS